VSTKKDSYPPWRVRRLVFDLLKAGSNPMFQAQYVRTAMQAPPAAHGIDNANTLFNELYSELHRLARSALRGQASQPGLGATTLLHEAYLAMSGRQDISFVDRSRFMGYAARVMRGLIIDDVRRHRSQKRGGAFEIIALRTFHGEVATDRRTLLRINDALDELAAAEPELAEVIELKFFCGLSFAEIAALRGASERTVQRHWEKGRLYLYQAMGGAPTSGVAQHAAHR
jgi:RNA polymerase sigma factor (TIGR02999 family)